jgi:hypothetical protein
MVKNKEQKMKVAELIAVLQKMDPDLDVEMAMEMEYQCPVVADFVKVDEYNGYRYVCIRNDRDLEVV